MESSPEKKSYNFKEVETRLEEMFAGIEDENVDAQNQSQTNNISVETDKQQDVVEITKCLSLEFDGKEILNNTDTIPEIENHQEDQHQQQSQVPHTQVRQQNKTFKRQPNENISKKKKPAKKFKPMIKTDKKKNNEPSKKEENNLKIRGPYIQIKSDNTVYVNNSSSDEYLENKAKKINSNSVKNEISKLKGLYVSTLSTRYDADTTDVSWLCVFCKKGPHKFGLGDLYGPYIIQPNTDSSLNGELNSVEINASNSNIKKKRTEKESPKQIVSTGMLEISDDTFEVWCHEDCIVWAAGVYLIGLKVIGLENAVWSSNSNNCTHCELSGAIICCLSRGCSNKAHFPCAKLTDWFLEEMTFKTYCPDHHIF